MSLLECCREFERCDYIADGNTANQLVFLAPGFSHGTRGGARSHPFAASVCWHVVFLIYLHVINISCIFLFRCFLEVIKHQNWLIKNNTTFCSFNLVADHCVSLTKNCKDSGRDRDIMRYQTQTLNLTINMTVEVSTLATNSQEGGPPRLFASRPDRFWPATGAWAYTIPVWDPGVLKDQRIPFWDFIPHSNHIQHYLWGDICMDLVFTMSCIAYQNVCI